MISTRNCSGPIAVGAVKPQSGLAMLRDPTCLEQLYWGQTNWIKALLASFAALVPQENCQPGQYTSGNRKSVP